MNKETEKRYAVEVLTIGGHWSIDQTCHLLGDLDKQGFHTNLGSAQEAMRHAPNDGRERKITYNK